MRLGLSLGFDFFGMNYHYDAPGYDETGAEGTGGMQVRAGVFADFYRVIRVGVGWGDRFLWEEMFIEPGVSVIGGDQTHRFVDFQVGWWASRLMLGKLTVRVPIDSEDHQFGLYFSFHLVIGDFF